MLPPSAWSLFTKTTSAPPRPRHHVAAPPRRAVPAAGAAAGADVTIRRAVPADSALLSALAAMDSSRPLHGDALVAEVSGAPVAAFELASGRAIADPFGHTAEAVELLRVRAHQLEQIDGADHRRRHGRFTAVTGFVR